jgi:hypothetical protein
VKLAPVTVNVVFPLPAATALGEIEARVGGGFTSVTDAVADCAESVMLAAVTVTVLGDGRLFGAVYRPVLSITPAAEFPPVAPFTDHDTPAVLPLTVAENCTCPPSATCAV